MPVPSDADSPKFKATSGSTKWVPEKNVVQWNIKSFPVSFNKICPKFPSLYYAYVLVIAMARGIMFLGFLFVCSSLSSTLIIIIWKVVVHHKLFDFANTDIQVIVTTFILWIWTNMDLNRNSTGTDSYNQ